jgi:DNA-binding NtrC family response regulator
MARQARTGRLLIVDDDQPLRLILAWGFEDLGYRVWTAAGYRQAVAAASHVAFDFILLDYRLPDGDGHTLSAYLARQQPQARIVLMSADRAAAVAEIDSDPVAEAFVEKPVRLGRLHHFFRRGDVIGR